MPNSVVLRTHGLAGIGLITVFAFSVPLVCGCGPSYEVHIGWPFYSLDLPSYARFYGDNVLRNRAGRGGAVRGVYTLADSVFIPFPVVRFFDQEAGLHYAPLLTELSVEDGDLVEVKGRVVQMKIPVKGSDWTQVEDVLAPEEVSLLSTSSELKKTAQREYLAIRDELQKKITPKGSRLVLPTHPRWFVVWSETDGSFIVSTRCSDLMYQAEIDLVFDGPSNTLVEVYAVEWFKGE